MTDVHVGLDVGDEHLTLAHGILSVLRDIDGCLDSAAKLELVCLNGDDTDEWHFDDELLWILVVQAVLLDAPFGTFKEESLDVCARVEAFGDLGRVSFLGDLSVHQTLVKWPLASTASSLEQSGQV